VRYPPNEVLVALLGEAVSAQSVGFRLDCGVVPAFPGLVRV
jgi:hypothetical protein